MTRTGGRRPTPKPARATSPSTPRRRTPRSARCAPSVTREPAATAAARTAPTPAEAAHAPVRTLRAIRDAGARAGLAVNPGTAVEPYQDLLSEIDMLLLMTVEPGFGGQHFLDMVLPKLRRARALVAERGAQIWLQVDGGVHEETIERCAEAGADVFVAGSAVFGSDDPARAVQALRAQAERATAHAAWAAQGRAG